MQKNFILVFSYLFFSFAMMSASASNFSFLTDAPVSYFTSQDWEIFTAAENKAIQTKDGTKTSWKNPDTGAWGYFIPLHTRIENGVLCKDLRVVDTAKQRSGEATYKICKTAKGWKAM